MQLTQTQDGDVLKIAGTLDISVADSLREALTNSFHRYGVIRVDLSDVETCDTAALQLLYSARQSAARDQAIFQITALSPAIAKTIAALGLQVDDLTAGVPSGDSHGL